MTMDLLLLPSAFGRATAAGAISASKTRSKTLQHCGHCNRSTPVRRRSCSIGRYLRGRELFRALRFSYKRARTAGSTCARRTPLSWGPALVCSQQPNCGWQGVSEPLCFSRWPLTTVLSVRRRRQLLMMSLNRRSLPPVPGGQVEIKRRGASTPIGAGLLAALAPTFCLAIRREPLWPWPEARTRSSRVLQRAQARSSRIECIPFEIQCHSRNRNPLRFRWAS